MASPNEDEEMEQEKKEEEKEKLPNNDSKDKVTEAGLRKQRWPDARQGFIDLEDDNFLGSRQILPRATQSYPELWMSRHAASGQTNTSIKFRS